MEPRSLRWIDNAARAQGFSLGEHQSKPGLALETRRGEAARDDGGLCYTMRTTPTRRMRRTRLAMNDFETASARIAVARRFSHAGCRRMDYCRVWMPRRKGTACLYTTNPNCPQRGFGQDASSAHRKARKQALAEQIGHDGTYARTQIAHPLTSAARRPQT